MQTLAHILVEKQSGRADRPSTLVIAPTSLMANWRLEAAALRPGPQSADAARQRAETAFRRDRPAATSILTTYALLRYDKDVLLARDYHLVILDEAQNIKNPKATTTQIGPPAESAPSPLPERHTDGKPSGRALVPLPFPEPRPARRQPDRFRRVSFERRSKSTMMLIEADFWRAASGPIFSAAPRPRSRRTCPKRPRSSKTSSSIGDQRDLYESIRLAMHERVKPRDRRQGGRKKPHHYPGCAPQAPSGLL